MTKQRKLKNHVIFVLDQSLSMTNIRNDVVNLFNTVTNHILKESCQKHQDTHVSLIVFPDAKHYRLTGLSRPQVRILNADIQTLKPLCTYDPAGDTPLADAVLLATDTVKDLYNNDDCSYLVIVITDGHENRSSTESKLRIGNELKRLQATDRWTITFKVPRGNRYTVERLGVHPGNIEEWDQTSEGTQVATVSTQCGLTSYFDSRAAGAKSVRNFYVNTNLSKLSAGKVKTKLTDVSDAFKPFDVSREIPVKEFVESKTRRQYVIGSSYYQLMKPEVVQANKQVLIMEKGKRAVWGGQEARSLIGLPAGESAKVTPGNHANYDIFVQSTSVNRKLVRGTKVLVDTNMSKGLKPTWDHTKTNMAGIFKKNGV